METSHHTVEAFGNDVRLQHHPSALPFARVWKPRNKTARRLTRQLMRRSRVSLCLCSPEERAEPEQATLTGETLTWYSTKDPPISHRADRKQIETGRKSIVETNDGQAWRIIWHCLDWTILPSPCSCPAGRHDMAHIRPAFRGYLMARSLLKTAVITVPYESICPSIRENSQKAWRENRDWIMRAEAIKKLEGF